MAAQTLLVRDATTQLPKEVVPVVVSSGISSANQPVALNAAGELDVSVLKNIDLFTVMVSL
jgi:hypothetical protein